MNTSIDRILKNPLSSATSLNAICLKLYGQKYYTLEPETISYMLETAYPNIKIPSINYTKINSIATLITTDLFYSYYEPFEQIGNVLNMNDVFPEVGCPLSPSNIVWALIESDLNDEEHIPFSGEVNAYIASSFKNHGSTRIPDIIDKYTKIEPFPAYVETNGQLEFEADIEMYVKIRLRILKEEMEAIHPVQIMDKIKGIL